MTSDPKGYNLRAVVCFTLYLIDIMKNIFKLKKCHMFGKTALQNIGAPSTEFYLLSFTLVSNRKNDIKLERTCSSCH
jgi:hypothetical protein